MPPPQTATNTNPSSRLSLCSRPNDGVMNIDTTVNARLVLVAFTPNCGFENERILSWKISDASHFVIVKFVIKFVIKVSMSLKFLCLIVEDLLALIHPCIIAFEKQLFSVLF